MVYQLSSVNVSVISTAFVPVAFVLSKVESIPSSPETHHQIATWVSPPPSHFSSLPAYLLS